MSYSEFDKRMRRYEEPFCMKLVPHMPTIVRLDGKCFHKYTRGCVKPFDTGLINAFQYATIELCREMGIFIFAYGQSDEVSLLMYNPDSCSNECFDGKIFKLTSVLASVFTYYFNKSCYKSIEGGKGFFDCRVFQLPKSEVANYFIWRQKDAERNSLQMLAQSQFSQKELHGKNRNDLQDMLMLGKSINWNDLPTEQKRGWGLKYGVAIDFDIPIFSKDREYIEEIINDREEQ